MPRFGSDSAYMATNLSSTTDSVGNAVISSNNDFGASPLGPAARAQALYGIANPNFNLLPSDPNVVITAENPLPYWGISIGGTTISAQTVYDSTTQTWAVRITPGSASSGDFLSLTTRSYLLNDTNLALRQKGYATLARGGTNGSNTWNLVLSATYYDVAGAQLSTFNLGTVADNGTATSISNVTTSGSAAISASAAYVDFAFTLTASASVTGTATIDLDSLLIATSAPTTGSFQITQTFTSSGTWARPTGVNYVDLMVIGAGSGGRGGQAQTQISSALGNGGQGGAGGSYSLLRDVYVGGEDSWSVGVGAGGVGGAGGTVTKAAAGTVSPITADGSNGASGGAMTFGSLSISTYFGIGTAAGGTAGVGGGSPGGDGGASGMDSFSGLPYAPALISGGAAGSAGTGSSASGGVNGAGGSAATGTANAGGGGGGGGAAQSAPTNLAGAGGVGRPGAGSGGGGAARNRGGVGPIVATGGAGANAPSANYGTGGGGGGGAAWSHSTTAGYNAAQVTLTGGAGGSGQSGLIVLSWVA